MLLVNISACSGYKPIFSSTNSNYKITDYTILGEKKLGYQIYSKLYNFTKGAEQNPETKMIYVTIEVVKDKKTTSKSSTGAVLAYKLNLSTRVIFKDLTTGNEIFNEKFDESSSYKAQNQYSETILMENKSIDNLINKTFENLVIKLPKNI
jgi:hypothetical protein